MFAIYVYSGNTMYMVGHATYKTAQAAFVASSRMGLNSGFIAQGNTIATVIVAQGLGVPNYNGLPASAFVYGGRIAPAAAVAMAG